MPDNPNKTTVGGDHLRSLKGVIDGLKKIVDEAIKKNKDDKTAKDLESRWTKLDDSFGEMEAGRTQMSVYEGLKERVTNAAKEFPKLAKEVKKPGETDEKPVEVKWKYSNSKVEKACKADSHSAARIEEVVNHGYGYLGHKAVSAIKAQGHVHVGNDNGIAFNWKSKSELVIVAYGSKNNNAKPGFSGYDWIT